MSSLAATYTTRRAAAPRARDVAGAALARARTLLPALVLGAALWLAGAPLRAQGFKVVVNAANPVTALRRDEVSRLLLKKVTTWRSGGPVRPVDLDEKSLVHQAVCRSLHGREADAVRSYWQQQIFSGRASPPPERASDADVIAFVRANVGAIGYVSPDAALPGDVRALDLLP